MGFGFSSKPFFLFLSFLVFFTNLELYPLVESAPDYTTLVYKGCAKQSFTDPAGIYSQALSALFQTLLSQSMKIKFYKTTTGTGQTTITTMVFTPQITNLFIFWGNVKEMWGIQIVVSA
ncbi:hypothetical protein Gogos_003488 [Gossypium gossypioides]|uniref:Uncharacterized protein n=1 Tax=Gossypium gossypioides TaxID=34282 RepID=A0A7J9CMQ9_GOSGO|nr:hypothetical protein [Gossypium gossypioides]